MLSESHIIYIPKINEATDGANQTGRIKRTTNSAENHAKLISSNPTAKKVPTPNYNVSIYCASLISDLSFDSAETSSNGSWFSLVIGYAALAVVFSAVKIITMNNLDHTGYDYLIYYLRKMISATPIASKRPQQVCCKTLLNIKCTTCFQKPLANKPAFTEQPSKFILYGTLRVFSFLLIIAYEGKIYNSSSSSNSGSSFTAIFPKEEHYGQYPLNHTFEHLKIGANDTYQRERNSLLSKNVYTGWKKLNHLLIASGLRRHFESI